jgi:hypothetical protein
MNLIKEIGVLKEKIMLYETIEHEKLSLHDSKLSKYSRQSSMLRES